LQQLSKELLDCARKRLQTSISERTESDLRRATSDLYYALFHALCGALVQDPPNTDSSAEYIERYISLYRIPDHRQVEKRCRDTRSLNEFDPKLQRFAKQLVAMKNKRELADYHPLHKFDISAVGNDLETVKVTLEGFVQVSNLERARFATFIGMGRR